MKSDTPTSTDKASGLANRTAGGNLTETIPGGIGLLAYVSHASTAIQKDSMPFSTLVNIQRREELLAAWRHNTDQLEEL